MSKTLVVIADADALIASVTPEDANHQMALKINRRLEELEAHVIFPTTALVEGVTVLHRKIGNPQLTSGVVKKIVRGDFITELVDETHLKEAGEYFKASGSKKNTFFDAIVCAVAKRHQADYIFSFDDWYDKLGFELTEKIIL